MLQVSLRLSALISMIDVLDGPDIEVRAFATDVPPVISPLVVARRDVFLAFDGLRSFRPSSTILFSAPEAVSWATRYFDLLFGEAPYRLRTPRGIDEPELARFREAVRRANPDAWPTGER